MNKSLKRQNRILNILFSGFLFFIVYILYSFFQSMNPSKAILYTFFTFLGVVIFTSGLIFSAFHIETIKQAKEQIKK